MTEEDFKRILKESLKSIRNEQRGLVKEQKELRKLIEERVLPPLNYIEITIKSYADRYVANEDHIRRLDKRLNAVENNLDIQPPQDLTIPALD